MSGRKRRSRLPEPNTVVIEGMSHEGLQHCQNDLRLGAFIMTDMLLLLFTILCIWNECAS